MSTLFRTAINISLNAHKNQKNKYNGEPYFNHPNRVAKAMRLDGFDDVYLCVAILHDVVEDTNVTYDDIERKLIAYCPSSCNEIERIIKALDCITHRDGESQSDYYKRIMSDDIACNVKKYDIEDNSRRNSQVEDSEARERLNAKYTKAKRFIGF